jgi:hypothetical protein
MLSSTLGVAMVNDQEQCLWKNSSSGLVYTSGSSCNNESCQRHQAGQRIRPPCSSVQPCRCAVHMHQMKTLHKSSSDLGPLLGLLGWSLGALLRRRLRVPICRCNDQELGEPEAVLELLRKPSGARLSSRLTISTTISMAICLTACHQTGRCVGHSKTQRLKGTCLRGLVLHSPADLIEQSLHERRRDLRRRIHQPLIEQQTAARIPQRLYSIS